MRPAFRDRLRTRLSRLSPHHWSAAAVIASFALSMGSLGLGLALGSTVLGVEGQAGIEELIGRLASGPWAPLAVMLVFFVLALVGVPQFALIAATVAVFGPWLGALYSWLATMGSAIFGFMLGRVFAQRMVRRYGGARINAASKLIARHGILSSALVRNVPSGPFVVLNVAAGASHMALIKFIIGTALGIVPKIVFISLLGTGVIGLLARFNARDAVLVTVVIALWILLGFGLRRYWVRLTGRPAKPPAASSPAEGS